MYYNKLATTAGSAIAIAVIGIICLDMSEAQDLFQNVVTWFLRLVNNPEVWRMASWLAQRACLLAIGWTLLILVLERAKQWTREFIGKIWNNKAKIILLLLGILLLLQKNTTFNTISGESNTHTRTQHYTAVVEYLTLVTLGYLFGRQHLQYSPNKSEVETKSISFRLGRIDAESKDDSRFEKLVASQFEIVQKQIERIRKRLDKAEIPVYAALHEEKKKKVYDPTAMDVETEVDQVGSETAQHKAATEKPKKDRNGKCSHCAGTTHESHRCWVLKKNIKCFKCGGTNHIAISCQNLKTGGMQFQVQKELELQNIEAEIRKLQDEKQKLIRKADNYVRVAGREDQDSFLSRSSRLN